MCDSKSLLFSKMGKQEQNDHFTAMFSLHHVTGTRRAKDSACFNFYVSQLANLLIQGQISKKICIQNYFTCDKTNQFLVGHVLLELFGKLNN